MLSQLLEIMATKTSLLMINWSYYLNIYNTAKTLISVYHITKCSAEG